MRDSAGAGPTAPAQFIDAEALLLAAIHHTDRALDGVASRDRHVRLDSALHAGAAVELAAKSLVARVDPELVLEPEDPSRQLIDKYVREGLITGKPKEPGPRRTISATKAVQLAQRVVTDLEAHKVGALHALDIRNAAAHAATLEAEHLEGRVLAAARYVFLTLEVLSRSPRGIFGEERYAEILAQIEGRTTALRIAAERKVGTARGYYRRSLVGIPTEGVAEVLSLRDHGPQHGDWSDRLKCPACRNEGWAYWRVDVDVEYEGPGEQSVHPFLSFMGFQCPFCLLELSDEEWDALDLSPHGDPADEFDVIPDTQEEAE